MSKNALEQALAKSLGIDAFYQAYQFLVDDIEEAKDISRDARAVLHECGYDGKNHNRVLEALKQKVREYSLCESVRSGWSQIGSELQPYEFCIDLCLNGPTVWIQGKLDVMNSPYDAEIFYAEDGGDKRFTNIDREALDWFCTQFKF